MAFPGIPDRLDGPKEYAWSLQDCILRALDVNYDVEIQRIDTELADSRVMAARSAFEPSLFGQGRHGDNEDLDSSREVDSTAIGVRTRLGLGTDLSLSAEYVNADTATNGTGRAVASISQPLLRNAGFKVNRASLKIARRNVDISLYDLENQMISTATEIENLYWDLVSSRERLKVQRDSLEQSRSLEKLTRERVDAGVLSESDIVESQAAVYDNETSVVRAEESVRTLEDSLKEALVLFENPDYWEAALVPTTLPEPSAVNFQMLDSLRVAFASRPDYLASMDRLKNDDIALYVAKNSLLPKLDLVAQGERARDDAFDWFAYDAVTGNNEQIWSLLLRFEVPLGNQSARAERDQVTAQREQRVLLIKQLELRIIREVRRAVDALNTARQIVETTRRAMEFETLKLENESAKLELGKSTTDNVVRFIQSLNRAKLSHVQAVVDYNGALTRLERVRGTTLDRYGVMIDGNDK